MADPNITVLQRQTYLKMIENSVGTRIFNSVFVRYGDSQKVEDVLHDGEYSCAFFVSSLLVLAKLFDSTHTTVKTVMEKAKARGWQEIPMVNVEAGDILFWEKMRFEDGSENAHVGFSIGNQEAVSTSYKEHQVTRHPIEAEGRKIAIIYRPEFIS